MAELKDESSSRCLCGGAGFRRGASDIASIAALRDDGESVCGGSLHDERNLFGRGGSHDGKRFALSASSAVQSGGGDVGGIGYEPRVTHGGAECIDDFLIGRHGGGRFHWRNASIIPSGRG